MSNFLDLRGFFPKGLDYSEITDQEDIPYVMTIDGTSYAMTSVNSSGRATLSFIEQQFETDGYLSNLVAGSPLISSLDIRFGVDTETFLSSHAGSLYVELIDRNSGSFAENNNGTWRVDQVYDGKNVRLRRSSGTWSTIGGPDPGSHLDWRLVPSAPSVGPNKTFSLDINHDELIRHNLIGTGCHPAVKATIDSFNNRFPDASNLIFPDLPDLEGLISDIDQCMAAMAPENVTTDYVLNNYSTIATGAEALQNCISGQLTGFSDELTEYVGGIYPRIFDQENSTLSADPLIQIVGENIDVTLVPFDINGARLAQTLPPGIIDATIFSDVGVLSGTQEVFDVNGNSTGDFEATLTSYTPTIVRVSAQVGGKDVAYFNGETLVKREIEVKFIKPVDDGDRALAITGERTEPLGVGNVE
jgi:hypothetical protein